MRKQTTRKILENARDTTKDERRHRVRRAIRVPIMRRDWIVAAALCCLAGLAIGGCGAAEDGQPTSESASYVANASNGEIFIQWVRTGASLNGSLQQTMLENSNSSEVSSDSSGFSGTIHGNAISLKLDQGLGGASMLVGHMSGRNMVLTYPGTDGTLLDLHFVPGKVADFNAGVKSLRTAAIETHCILYAEGNDAQIEFTGGTAGEDCQSFSRDISTSDIPWSTTGSGSSSSLTGVCQYSNGSDLAVVSDYGAMQLGQQACSDFDATGGVWEQPNDP